MIRTGVQALGAVILLLAVFLAYGTVPNRWYHILYVYSGSMAPAIHAGDLILVSPPTIQLKPGMILTMAVNGHLVTHRLVERRPDGSVLTKGDANAAPDDWGNSKVEVRAIYRARVPLLGYLVALPRNLINGAVTGAWFTNFGPGLRRSGHDRLAPT